MLHTEMNMIQALLVAGSLMMGYNLFTSVRMRRTIAGGIIGTRLGQLIAFIALFAAGYLAIGILVWPQAVGTPLLPLLLSLILTFGAVFVFLVRRLVRAITLAPNA